mgnify:CR=1 FL=1
MGDVRAIFLIIVVIILVAIILIIIVQLENAAHFRRDIRPPGDRYSRGEWAKGSRYTPVRRRSRKSNDSSVRINFA